MASELSERFFEHLQGFLCDEEVPIARLRLQMDTVIHEAMKDFAAKLSEDLMAELVQEFTDSLLDSMHNMVSLDPDEEEEDDDEEEDE